MSYIEPLIRIHVDNFNPGQFFACCGLLELADRLWPGAEGYFDQDVFYINGTGKLQELIEKAVMAPLIQIDPDDETASPIFVENPFNLRLDWWKDEYAGGNRLKVWAGRMSSLRIARAMQQATGKITELDRMFDFSTVVHDPDPPRKKVEPFYFDSRRGWSSRSIDIGFAPDSLQFSTLAYPAVEFFCLIGLQRYRPRVTNSRRIFEYFIWRHAMPTNIAATAVSNLISHTNRFGYRFENAFRTDQKKHKAFQPATAIGV